MQMARDSRVRMRDGLVIPGAILTFYGLLAIIYAEQIRAKSDYCTESNLILIAGICYTVWKLILPIVLIGIALIITGAVAFRGEPEDLEGHLHHGTGAHTTLALLVSLPVVALTAWIIQTVREARSGRVFELNILGARYEHTFLLELVVLVSLLVLLPFLGMYISLHVKRRRFEHEATQILSQESEARLPHERGYQYGHAVPATAAHAASMTPDEEWPDGRESTPGPQCQQEGCSNPAAPGTPYCTKHACSGRTLEGAPCRNPAGPAGRCPVHARPPAADAAAE